MNRAATVTLTPLSGLYGVAMKARRALYRRGVFHVHKAGVPVISVGNITTGGTGKTPLVEWIARALRRRQKRLCILTRGYGRQHGGRRVLVSNGSEIFADARDAGDEPLLLAEKLKGEAAVICDADRVAAARWATENLGTDLFILDDGFQNMRLARDCNIVAIDATNPWGNRRLLPAGTLRESPRQLARADRSNEEIGRRSEDVDDITSARAIPHVIGLIDSADGNQSLNRGAEDARVDVGVQVGVALIASVFNVVSGDRNE